MEQVQHLGEDTTLLRVGNRSHVSGVRYRRDPARTRLAIEAALADAPSGRAPELGAGPASGADADLRVSGAGALR
ncbi:hypothetical protein [Streptomyces sp. YKOK-I1]